MADLPLHRIQRSNPPARRNEQLPAINLAELEERILARLEKRVSVVPIPFATQSTAFTLRKSGLRYWMLIQNIDVAGSIIVNFSTSPDITTGLTLNPGGFWESEWCPQSEVFVIGSAPGVRGFAIFAEQLAE